MGKGGGGTEQTRGVGGGCKIKGEVGRGWQWGALCLVSLGGTCLWRGGAEDCNHGGGSGISKCGGVDEKLAVLHIGCNKQS
jgi:hypothetical protein